RRLFRSPVDRHNRAGLDDTGQVEELIVLPERLLARPLGRALHDRHTVSDSLHQARAPVCEFLDGEDLGAGENRLRRRPKADAADRDDDGEKADADHGASYLPPTVRISMSAPA